MNKGSSRPAWFKMFLHQKALIDSVPDETAGKALKAVFRYFDTGEAVDLDPLSFAVFAAIKPYIDESFEDFQKKSEKNRINVMKRWKPNDTACTNGNDCIPLDTKNTEAEAEAEAEAETEAETESTAPPAAMPAPPEPKNDKPERHKHGQYGWVRLSDEEYNRLSNDLGETELKRCIAYIDESAQSSGNKNRWRDWNLVIRRCHRDGWGKNKGTSRNAVKTAADYENGDDFLSC